MPDDRCGSSGIHGPRRFGHQVSQWQIVEITRPEVGLRYTNARLGEHVG
jgi:hypothetical protein